MEIKKYFRGENTYEFVCESWETSYAWGHKATMFKNGIQYKVAKVRYYNRTWENWTYQSVIRQAIWLEIEDAEKALIEVYKHLNNVKKLRAEKKQEIIDADVVINELKDLRKAIGEGQRSGEF